MKADKRKRCPTCAQIGGMHSEGCYRRPKMETPENGPSSKVDGAGSKETPERAMRHNEGKPKMSYMTDFPVAMEGLARVMMLGEDKYERDNWKLGITINEYLDSFLRHATDYKKGIVFDKESGLHQFFHMAVNAMMLAEIHGKPKDGRVLFGIDKASSEDWSNVKIRTEDDETVYAVFKKDGWTRVEDGHLMTEEEVVAMKRANLEEGRMMTDDDSDAAAYAMMAADIIVDSGAKRRDERDDIATGREDEPNVTVAGTVSTAEDGPLLDSTQKPVSELCEEIARRGSGTGVHPMEIISEYFRLGLMDKPDRDNCRKWLCDNQGDYLYVMEKLDPVMPDEPDPAVKTGDVCFAATSEDGVKCMACNFRSDDKDANLPCKSAVAKNESTSDLMANGAISEICEYVADMAAANDRHPMEIIAEYLMAGLLTKRDRHLCRKWLCDNQRNRSYYMSKVDPLMPDEPDPLGR